MLNTYIIVWWDARYFRTCPYFTSYSRMCFEILGEVGKSRLDRWWGVRNSNVKSHKRSKCLGHRSATSRNFQFWCQHRSKAVQLRYFKVWSEGKTMILHFNNWHFKVVNNHNHRHYKSCGQLWVLSLPYETVEELRCTQTTVLIGCSVIARTTVLGMRYTAASNI